MYGVQFLFCCIFASFISFLNLLVVQWRREERRREKEHKTVIVLCCLSLNTFHFVCDNDWETIRKWKKYLFFRFFVQRRECKFFFVAFISCFCMIRFHFFSWITCFLLFHFIIIINTLNCKLEHYKKMKILSFLH